MVVFLYSMPKVWGTRCRSILRLAFTITISKIPDNAKLQMTNQVTNKARECLTSDILSFLSPSDPKSTVGVFESCQQLINHQPQHGILEQSSNSRASSNETVGKGAGSPENL